MNQQQQQIMKKGRRKKPNKRIEKGLFKESNEGKKIMVKSLQGHSSTYE
jgi:hypothetical protein